MSRVAKDDPWGALFVLGAFLNAWEFWAYGDEAFAGPLVFAWRGAWALVGVQDEGLFAKNALV